MEVITSQSLSYANLPKPTTTSLSPPFFHFRGASHPPTLLGFIGLPRKLRRSSSSNKIRATQQRKFGAIFASKAEITSTDEAERWVLEPVGDGDSRHIGFKVPLPDAFEIASSVLTVGGDPERAEMVIPVATVSGLHARIEKKEGSLLVTDLDSTNGTFVDDKRLSPGVPAAVVPGRCITFGDTNLAKFRVSKLANAKVSGESAESEGTEGPSNT